MLNEAFQDYLVIAALPKEETAITNALRNAKAPFQYKRRSSALSPDDSFPGCSRSSSDSEEGFAFRYRN
jgi:hypothetical protein